MFALDHLDQPQSEREGPCCEVDSITQLLPHYRYLFRIAMCMHVTVDRILIGNWIY
jgi:hypothetical protein